MPVLERLNRISVPDEFFYIILDKSNRNILAATNSKGAAMAMSLWQSRISMNVVSNKNSRRDDQQSIDDFLDINRCYKTVLGDLNEDFVLTTVPKADKKSLKILRREVIRRLLWQTKLASRCERGTTAVPENIFLEKYSETILSELDKCRPDKQYYTEPIKDYARITDCSNDVAYNELKLHMDNIAHSRLRNLGLYIKFRNKLNQVNGDHFSQKLVYEEFLQEMIGNSKI
jgi:hypothetical protein